MNFEYFIENEKIYFNRNGIIEDKELDGICIMYDADDSVLLKHGSPAIVQNYFSNFITKLNNGRNTTNGDIIDEMINSSQLITISKENIINNMETLKDINKVLSHSNYIKEFSEKYGE